MRVIFVDDEPRVLAAMERALYAHDCDWECEFAGGGRAALAALEHEPADVIVSDMRMPLMDGAELLAQVKQRWPRTIRMILSGQTSDDDAMRVHDVAHQFLSKPCDNAVLIAKVTRALALRAILDNPVLLEFAGGVGHLPPAPKVFLELVRLLTNPATSGREVSDVIARDPALCAKLLQLANSAYFANGRSIESVSAAVARLGFSTVQLLVLSSEVFGGCDAAPDVTELQRRSLAASLIAARIAGRGKPAEAAATAALLADLGFLLPGLRNKKCPDEVSVHVDHYLHAEAGAYLLGIWGLPLDIVEAVAHHCSPLRVEEKVFDTVGVVHVAVALSDRKLPDQEYLRRVGRAADWPRWQALAAELLEDAA